MKDGTGPSQSSYPQKIGYAKVYTIIMCEMSLKISTIYLYTLMFSDGTRESSSSFYQSDQQSMLSRILNQTAK